MREERKGKIHVLEVLERIQGDLHGGDVDDGRGLQEVERNIAKRI